MHEAPRVGEIWKYDYDGGLTLVLILNCIKEECLCLVDNTKPDLNGKKAENYYTVFDRENNHWVRVL